MVGKKRRWRRKRGEIQTVQRDTVHLSRCSAYRAKTSFLSFPQCPPAMFRATSRPRVDHLHKYYLPALTPWNISDGIATPEVGHYIQSRSISGSFLLPTDLVFQLARFKQFD